MWSLSCFLGWFGPPYPPLPSHPPGDVVESFPFFSPPVSRPAMAGEHADYTTFKPFNSLIHLRDLLGGDAVPSLMPEGEVGNLSGDAAAFDYLTFEAFNFDGVLHGLYYHYDVGMGGSLIWSVMCRWCDYLDITLEGTHHGDLSFFVPLSI